MTTLIEISKIAADQSAQPRFSIQVDRVTEYTEDMDRGDAFPPLVVFYDGGRYWLADGFHRFYAATNAGRRTVECDVKPGGLRDAVLYSCGANAAHGMRRTNEDKRRAVGRLLLDDEWVKWSDSEIARRCAVDPKTVSSLRKELVTMDFHSEERTYVTKHGTESTMATGGIGRKATATELPPDGPLIAKSLREIERYLDMMPDPSDAVAHFPEDQHYLYPVSKLESMAQWLANFAAYWRSKIVEKARGTAA